MTITMNDAHLGSIAQIKEFIKVAKGIEFKGALRKEKYEWLADVLNRFRSIQSAWQKAISVEDQVLYQDLCYSGYDRVKAQTAPRWQTWLFARRYGASE